jgi:hypothetical protein
MEHPQRTFEEWLEAYRRSASAADLGTEAVAKAAWNAALKHATSVPLQVTDSDATARALRRLGSNGASAVVREVWDHYSAQVRLRRI